MLFVVVVVAGAGSYIFFPTQLGWGSGLVAALVYDLSRTSVRLV
jgi:hypothetical protein